MPPPSANAKLAWKPGTMLAPVPAVLVSCGGTGIWKPNLITIAWTGVACSEPPIVTIAIRPERYSYEIVKSTGEFAINVPSREQAWATDWCGVVSGRDTDKFAGAKLTPAPGLQVKCPVVAECPVNIECRVRQTLSLGMHTLFLGDVVAVQASAALVDAKGRFRLEDAGLFAYAHGQYYALGEHLGHFGFSVRKPGTKRRI